MAIQHKRYSSSRPQTANSYSAIPVMSASGIYDVFLAEGTMNGDRFEHFIREHC